MRTSSKLLLLASLYLSQGLPYGFFTQVLPVLMRQQGMSLETIGLSTVLMLPWGLKLFWAPLIDKHRGSPLGPRRGWIVPLQLATAAALAGLLFLHGEGDVMLGALAVGVVITSALAATQDCATDGLAVELLDHDERGHANGIQVAAYRIGMILGGGVLLVVFDLVGWSATFLSMAALLLLASVPVLMWRERGTAEEAPSASAVVLFSRFFRRPRAVPWLLLVVFYKLGDAFGSAMVRPFLVDQGYALARIGTIVGTLGSGAALLGAALGGWLAGTGRARALWIAGLVHAALMAAYALPALRGGDVGGGAVLDALVVVEHLTGSAATVALFTVMMDACDKRTGAVDYTIQASVVVWISFAGSALSGFSAHALGYGVHFLVAGALCVVGTAALAARLYRAMPPLLDDEPKVPLAASSHQLPVAAPTDP